jgi:uncharacterized protein (DUF1697 family)
VKRYVAFLRGVNPMNAQMPELKRAFELGGFGDVKTVLSSGNVVFSAPAAKEAALARRAEAAMKKHLGAPFFTLVRSVEALQQLLESEPYARFKLAAGSKRVVTFLAAPPQPKPKLPIELDGARILSISGSEVFSAYVPSPKGPAFMTLLQKTFGKEITTRTWDTVSKVAK